MLDTQTIVWIVVGLIIASAALWFGTSLGADMANGRRLREKTVKILKGAGYREDSDTGKFVVSEGSSNVITGCGLVCSVDRAIEVVLKSIGNGDDDEPTETAQPVGGVAAPEIPLPTYGGSSSSPEALEAPSSLPFISTSTPGTSGIEPTTSQSEPTAKPLPTELQPVTSARQPRG
jgi:hypothetical protein